jgi:hypothetical protein
MLQTLDTSGRVDMVERMACVASCTVCCVSQLSLEHTRTLLHEDVLPPSLWRGCMVGWGETG